MSDCFGIAAFPPGSDASVSSCYFHQIENRGGDRRDDLLHVFLRMVFHIITHTDVFLDDIILFIGNIDKFAHVIGQTAGCMTAYKTRSLLVLFPDPVGMLDDLRILRLDLNGGIHLVVFERTTAKCVICGMNIHPNNGYICRVDSSWAQSPSSCILVPGERQPTIDLGLFYRNLYSTID